MAPPSRTQPRQRLVRRYLDCLRNGDEAGIDALFAADAVVLSPIFGEREARAFFTELFSVTSVSDIELIEVFASVDTPRSVAAHFRYRWVLASGGETVFSCVDLFRLEYDRPRRSRWFGLSEEPRELRISKLQIIYDTYDARSKLDRAAGG